MGARRKEGRKWRNVGCVEGALKGLEGPYGREESWLERCGVSMENNLNGSNCGVTTKR